MELSERYIQTLEKEGFSNIEEIQLSPNEKHPERVLAMKTTVLVTDGSLLFELDGEVKEVLATERLNIPANKQYSVTVGPTGAIYIYGEKEIEDY